VDKGPFFFAISLDTPNIAMNIKYYKGRKVGRNKRNKEGEKEK
jgi:hypothetical protein